MMNENNVAHEIWRVIDEYENYEVSSHGRVRNTDTMKILKGRNEGHGYYAVNLWKNNKGKNHKIHRLVAFAFCNNDNDYDVVDHIDRNKLNNNWLNLRWTTFSINGRNTPLKSNNTSGIKGVRYDADKNRWRAMWNDNDKKHCNKSFNINKYGNDEAKQLAINYRKEMEKLYNYL